MPQRPLIIFIMLCAVRSVAPPRCASIIWKGATSLRTGAVRSKHKYIMHHAPQRYIVTLIGGNRLSTMLHCFNVYIKKTCFQVNDNNIYSNESVFLCSLREKNALKRASVSAQRAPRAFWDARWRQYDVSIDRFNKNASLHYYKRRKKYI